MDAAILARLLVVACVAACAAAQAAAPAAPVAPVAPVATAPVAPAPAPGVNLTAILVQAGANMFINMLRSTQAINQVQSQVGSNSQGITILAPSDAAFAALKPGTLNSLTDQEKTELLQYHVLPQYYSQGQFQSASNPVHTMASDSSGPFGINVTSTGATNSAVNITTGVVSASLTSPVYSKPPVAVYQIDKVLLPNEIFGAKAPASAPAPEAGAPLPAGIPSTSPASARDTTDTSFATAVSAPAAFLFSVFVLLVSAALAEAL